MRIVRYYPRAWMGDGGITMSVRRISDAMVRAGASVGVIVEDDPSPPSDGTFEWIPVPHAGSARFRRPLGLDRALAGADLLVLHSAWAYSNIAAASIARRLGVRYVLEPRGAYDPGIVTRNRMLKKAWWWTFERRQVRCAAAIHVFFESEREHLRMLGYRGATIVAPNGITVPPGIRWDGGSGGYVLWIGRFDPQHKGLDLLLHALRLLTPSERPELRLHGPDWAGGKERVVELIRRLGLNRWVRVGEPVYGDTKWAAIERAGAFVYPSRWEGFGNSPAEAAAVGVPTLVTPYPLGRWLAEQGLAVLADANPVALADGLVRVSRAAAPAGAREQLLREMNWDAVARSWLRQAEALESITSAGLRRELADASPVPASHLPEGVTTD